MKRAKTFSNATRVIFRPELGHCPFCRTRLTFDHVIWEKHIIRLDGVVHAVSHGYRCSRCHGPVYRSAEAESLALKYGTFGLDVIVRIGVLRYRDHLTRTEIHARLQQEGIPICERHVQNLYESYLVLIRCDLATTVERIRPTVMDHGGLVLSIDGIQPDKGNETLYLVRDALTSTTLAAENLLSGNAEAIKGLLRPVLELGLPILGVVTDGQLSIRKAVHELLPDTPYQYCQYHYLKDAAAPLVDQDRKLKTQLKKSLRGLKRVEDHLQDDHSVAGRVLLGFCSALRALLLERGCPPLTLPGLMIFERLQLIRHSLQRCLQRFPHARLQALLRLIAKTDRYAAWYETLQLQHGWLVQLAHMLDPEHEAGTPSPEARQRAQTAFLEYVDSLGVHGFDPLHSVLIENIRGYTKGFLPGLFTCFEHKLLPRTNNSLERFIRQSKARYRRITGRRSWSIYILREGEFAVFVDVQEPEEEQVQRLSRIADVAYRTRRQQWHHRREPTRQRWRFRQDPNTFLANLEAEWHSLHVDAQRHPV